MLLLAGSAVLSSAKVAADALANAAARRVLVSGGVGHSTPELWRNVRESDAYGLLSVEGRAEADILRDILVDRLGVPANLVVVESRSTNCGANAWESKRVLEKEAIDVRSMILVQDPTMQRRTHASFERAWRGSAAPRLVSFASVLPKLGDDLVLWPGGVWTFDRFVSLLLGEIPRLRDDVEGYGPRGRDYIEHVDIPDEVLASYGRVSSALPELAR